MYLFLEITDEDYRIITSCCLKAFLRVKLKFTTRNNLIKLIDEATTMTECIRVSGSNRADM